MQANMPCKQITVKHKHINIYLPNESVVVVVAVVVAVQP
jgi:hypothetical protein